MKQIFFILVLASLVISCSKEKAASNTELLTASPWFHMRSTSQIGGVTMEAPYSNFDRCVKDDPYIFTVDGKLQINQGVLRCSGEPDYAYQHQWQFKDNETTLAINNNYWTDWQIVKLTRDSLVIKMTDAAGVSTNFYSHQ